MPGFPVTDRRHSTPQSEWTPQHGFGDVGVGGKVIGVAGFDLPAGDPADGQWARYDSATGEWVWVDEGDLDGSLIPGIPRNSGGPGMDGRDGEDSYVPGPTGPAGPTGATGAAGSVTEQDHGNAGSTETIDFSAADIHRLTLNSASCAISFTGVPSNPTPAIINILLVQDGTGGRLATWPTITWKAGVAPTLSTAAGAIDDVRIVYDSINAVYIGEVVGTVVGPTGATGPQGTGMPGIDGRDGEDSYIPGPQGPAGAAGATGATGAAGSTIGHGTSNPSSPATNDLFYRDDKSLFIFYDGTRWLTTDLYAQTVGFFEQITSTHDNYGPVWTNLYDQWLVDFIGTFQSTGTLNGSNYWKMDLYTQDGGTLGSIIATLNNSTDSADTQVVRRVAINALLGTGKDAFVVDMHKGAGAPGAFWGGGMVTYRLVIT